MGQGWKFSPGCNDGCCEEDVPCPGKTVSASDCPLPNQFYVFTISGVTGFNGTYLLHYTGDSGTSHVFQRLTSGSITITLKTTTETTGSRSIVSLVVTNGLTTPNVCNRFTATLRIVSRIVPYSELSSMQLSVTASGFTEDPASVPYPCDVCECRLNGSARLSFSSTNLTNIDGWAAIPSSSGFSLYVEFVGSFSFSGCPTTPSSGTTTLTLVTGFSSSRLLWLNMNGGSTTLPCNGASSNTDASGMDCSDFGDPFSKLSFSGSWYQASVVTPNTRCDVESASISVLEL